MKRSIDTAYYTLAFPDESQIIKSKLLRELHFGKQEGLHFDGLPPQHKAQFSDPNFQAEDGESWHDLRRRALSFLSQLDVDDGRAYLVFTHGGWIASYLRIIDQESMMPPNCSVVGLTLKPGNTGEPESLDFRWEFPYIEEDI